MKYQLDQKAVAWARAAFEDGFPRGEWRKDRWGHWMAWSQFDSQESPYGWRVAEIPTAAVDDQLEPGPVPEAISHLTLKRLAPRVIAA